MINPKIDKSGIYCIKNLVNNKVYIGSAVNFNKRFYEHSWELNKNIHHNIYLQRSFNKYGESNFEFIILEYTEKIENLRGAEQKWMNDLNVLDVEYGYNICTKAENSSGYRHTEETIEKMREIAKNRPPVSKETKIKISKASKDRKHKPETIERFKEIAKNRLPMSEETKKKISESKKDHIVSEETRKKIGDANKGRVLSEESRENMSKSAKGRVKSKEHRKNLSESLKGNKNALGHNKGEKNGNAKLTEEDVLEIRELIKDGISNTAIAKMYGIGVTTISNIKIGKTWKHV